MPDETTATTATQTATTNSGEQTTQQTTEQQTQSTEQQSTEQKTTEQQTTEQKSTEQQVPVVPEKYEFAAPEGQDFSPAFLEAYSTVAKEIGLPQDKAQAIIDKVAPVLEKQQAEQIEKVHEEWKESTRTDKEFGGDKLMENLAVAKTALEAFGTPALKEMLNATGIGNHPELIRFFYKAGKALSEDGVLTGHKEGTGGPKNFNDLANALYGS